MSPALRTPTPTLDPALAPLAWPAHTPLVALAGHDTVTDPRHRFPTIAAKPASTTDLPNTQDAFDRIDHILAHARTNAAEPGGGFAVELSYELAAAAEPTAFKPPPTPAARLHRVEGGAAFDHDAQHWRPFGDARHAARALECLGTNARDQAPGAIKWPDPNASRARYKAAVESAVELIHAGDCFQVNLAHALSGRASAHPRTVFSRLSTHLRPLFACFLESASTDPVRTVVSASPELFLSIDPRPHQTDLSGAHATTRPIKGTRARGAHDELRSSDKDAAELAMIVDLMRNDLGRLAAPGTVRVDDRSRLELHHGCPAGRTGVAHTVATVSATLRPGTTPGELLRATFAPGSVTGAPKVRAMQIINQLERTAAFPARGAYCGALGWIGDDGNISLSVAIRTLTMSRTGAGDWEIQLPVGAGIVADSDPAAEWDETLVKAEPLIAALGGWGHTP